MIQVSFQLRRTPEGRQLAARLMNSYDFVTYDFDRFQNKIRRLDIDDIVRDPSADEVRQNAITLVDGLPEYVYAVLGAVDSWFSYTSILRMVAICDEETVISLDAHFHRNL